MRTVREILDSIKDNGPRPTEDESYNTILILDTAILALGRSIEEMVAALARHQDPLAIVTMQETLALMHTILDTDPQKFLNGYLPGTESYDADRQKIKEHIKEVSAQFDAMAAKFDAELDEIEVKELKKSDKLN